MLTVYQETFAPALDTAVSSALLRRVAEGSLGESLRLYRPQSIVAFGKRDVIVPGFGRAVTAARDQGFASVVRLAGGRAAVFHPGTVAFAWTIPTRDPRLGITERFQRMSDMLVGALRQLGADAHIGEVEGEYCPGEFSINLGGEVKVMGVGQRLVSGAAHVGGVVVVTGGEAIADVLIPVYRELELPFKPSTSGDLESAIPGISWTRVRDAVMMAFQDRTAIGFSRIDDETLRMATELQHLHDATIVSERATWRG